MFCSKCGRFLNGNENYCRSCGAPVVKDGQVVAQPIAAPAANMAPAPTPKKFTYKKTGKIFTMDETKHKKKTFALTLIACIISLMSLLTMGILLINPSSISVFTPPLITFFYTLKNGTAGGVSDIITQIDLPEWLAFVYFLLTRIMFFTEVFGLFPYNVVPILIVFSLVTLLITAVIINIIQLTANIVCLIKFKSTYQKQRDKAMNDAACCNKIWWRFSGRFLLSSNILVGLVIIVCFVFVAVLSALVMVPFLPFLFSAFSGVYLMYCVINLADVLLTGVLTLIPMSILLVSMIVELVVMRKLKSMFSVKTKKVYAEDNA